MISRVDKVRLLQQLLLVNGYQIAVDGDFGPGTAKALNDFKTKQGITNEDDLSKAVFEALAGSVRKLFAEPDLAEPDLMGVELHDDILNKLFPDSDKDFVQKVFNEVDANRELFKLNSPLRRAHSLAQVRSECGSSFSVSEGLNYSAKALRSIFRCYRKDPKMSEKHGRTSSHKANQKAIANHAYANRMGNGNITSGDGWRYRGRGIKQLTGKNNYRGFTKWYAKHFSDKIDFEKQPDLLSSDPKYAAISGAYFWVENKLYLAADGGATAGTVNAITTIINRDLPKENKRQRVRHFDVIWKIISG
jgi:predicted chitinase